MKFPLCEQCIEAEELCPACEQLLREGKITALDVAVSHLLGRLKRKLSLENADFVKALDLGKLVVIVATGKIGVFIGRKGRIVTEVSRELGRKVRVIEQTSDEKKMVQDLVGKAQVLGINKVFSPAGQEYKVVVAKKDAPRLVSGKARLEEAIRQLLGAKATIAFE
ncbi:MAG TPA: transcription elongation factor NusA [Candidatus Diapherotrites archaeon]|uniref:Transcription elongation factor NusA n=1 Tax=Candidatus Iainarchaeum sp. TaxID=3101447 RepID=A0A7J4JG84_9ARCH|nr:transcription elongation factor NusA [Candidatus Diapherotrites archaeon]HIH16324.1 transcription elongation factor NusA [Candidatus Diapherotrites archaeon]